MKTKKQLSWILISLSFVFSSFISFGQTGLRINGAKIIVTTGAILHIDGGQNGDLTASNVSSTEAKIDLDGTIKIEGDWVNNNSSADVLINKDTDGTIEINGTAEQNLSGSATNDFTFEKLKINAGAKLVLDDDQSLILGGDFTNLGYFRINSTASGSGSFLDNGTITQSSGRAQVGRYVSGKSGGTIHYFSPAVSNATGAQLINSNKGNYNVYKFNAATQTFDRVLSGTSLVATTGYTIAYTDSNTVYSDGALNYGTLTPGISSTDQEWNLVGNPYPSALNADDFLTANATGGTPSIYGTLYFWDESVNFDANDYASWNGTGYARTNANGTVPNGYIGTGQGFFVQSKTKTSNTLTFNNAMREKNNTQFFIPPLENVQRLKISVTNPNGDFNEILIGFLAEATYGIDNLYDGHKLQGNPDLSFYSMIPGYDRNLVIQGLPPLSQEEIIPIGLDVRIAGKYTFKVELIENFDVSTQIFLEDKAVAKLTDLRNADTYEFMLDEGVTDERFVIKFKPVTIAIDENKAESENKQPTISMQGNRLLIESLSDFSGTLRIQDLLGKELQSMRIENSHFETLQLNYAKGYYIVSIVGEDMNLSTKVFVK